jgi:hypothetical protein
MLSEAYGPHGPTSSFLLLSVAYCPKHLPLSNHLYDRTYGPLHPLCIYTTPVASIMLSLSTTFAPASFCLTASLLW